MGKVPLFACVILFILFCFVVDLVLGKVFSKCEILMELKNLKVDEREWSAWLCAANRESKLNSALKSHAPYSSNLGKGCTPHNFGIFQLTSDACRDEASNNQTCVYDICEAPCNYFLDDDIRDDIECVQKLRRVKDFWSPDQKLWLECTSSNSENISFNSLRCEGGNKSFNYQQDRDSASNINLPVVAVAAVTVSIALVLVIGITIGVAIIWIHHRKIYGGLTLEEIKEFKYGFRGRSSSTKSNSSNGSTTDRTFDAGTIPYDQKFEIRSSEYNIELEQSIGSGAFGIVFKGSVQGENVAVKCLKPHATKESLKSLLEEIKLMIYLGRHENIVRFVGASTKFLRKGIVYVFVEYCCLGSLENFLRSNRENFIDQIVNNEFVHIESILETGNFTVDAYQIPISSKDLISWAYQISKGMTFLASKKVIHGDLATRNVLLSDRNTIKISDFGLSRKLYNYCNYIKTKEEPLPWRWMALESLRDMTFSTKSDVWSFGVTLWEMFSLGNVPYPGVSWSVDFVDKLTDGLRMAKPRFSTIALYDFTMLRTWDEKPELRPTFSQLSDYFHDLLETLFSQNYTNLKQIVSKTSMEPEIIKD